MFAWIKKHRSLIFLSILLVTLAGSYLWNQYQMQSTRMVSLPLSRTDTTAAVPTPTLTKTPLAAYQEKREAARAEDMAALTALAANTAVDQAARDQAQEELREVIRCRESELAIEGALIGAGFSPCAAVVQKGAVTVLIGKKELTQAEANVILALAATHSGESPENIRIMAGEAV